MNLSVDIGNTRSKIALFEGDKLFCTQAMESVFSPAWEELFAQHNIENGILSSVKSNDEELLCFLQQKTKHFIELSHRTPLPIQIDYSTPETLGKDRLAAVIGAYTLMPQHDILVIDAGTAITFDFLSANGCYHGGAIAPGLTMRFRALHEFTGKLPLLSPKEDTPLVGRSTDEAIRSGVVGGMIAEIEAYAQALREQYPQLLIFLTGGDAFFFEKKLKSSIFANSNLVFIGLNRIIDYNVKI
jgi:type III pantothenate kinase